VVVVFFLSVRVLLIRVWCEVLVFILVMISIFVNVSRVFVMILWLMWCLFRWLIVSVYSGVVVMSVVEVVMLVMCRFGIYSLKCSASMVLDVIVVSSMWCLFLVSWISFLC